ncbi:L-type lectin-domain containing receptor kinase IX.1-like [Lolium rigidum]|uniref:L-type lectin-domain containing receptor kinase IX.1-like n=1 Tax=Lolium rigidum TaxID=89674 RepID=UPI001F5DDA42|nr:L-type lectin-domain containing receptor kinase IX.1-like [Lolium rigidum]
MDMNPRTFSTGRVSYAQPVRLWDAETGELGSFTTTFSFSIYAADSGSMLGDGVAFFLGHYPSSIPTNSWGGNLALMDLNNNRNVVGDKRIVAVEFDTLGNTDFPDVMGSYHMGIDINSIVSVAYTNISNDLRAGDVMTARISYDNVTQVLAADLRIGGTSYHVNETVNLRHNLPEEVAVGFSASTGLAIEVNKVLSWTFNSTLTGTDKRTRRPTNKLLAAAILPPAVFVLCVVLLCFWVWRLKATRWKKSNGGDEDSGPDEEDEEEAEFVRGVGPKRYGYRRLLDATGNFAEGNKLGQGGFGSVYKGELADQDGLVAVKMLSPESSGQGRKEFEAEVKIISQLRHRNLVRLLGWCDSHRGLLLVYECVAKGGLDRHIHGTGTCLTWRQRYNIILGLGSALRYLHEEVEQYVVHGDIKTSNIMLDSSYNAKLGDFGLARIVDPLTGPHTTRVVLGTPGYIDPEFVSTQRPSAESDMYSFGVVVLEIISGRRPMTKVRQDGEVNMLLEQVWDQYGEKTILKAVDERLVVRDELGKLQMERALLVGLWCAHPTKSERPSIGKVMHVLACFDVPLPALWPQMCNDNTSWATHDNSHEHMQE